MPTTDEWIASRTREYFDQLLPGLREDAETARTLANTFAAIASVDLIERNQIMALLDLLDPRSIPRPDWLPLLGSLVGFDERAGFPKFLDEQGWRKLLPYAGQIWRDKGISYRQLLVALVSRPVWIGYWHELRNVLDLTAFPWGSVNAPGGPDYHERTVGIHVPDMFGNYSSAYTPTGSESAVDRALVAAAVNAIRPGQQRVDLYWYDTVDDFSQGMRQWQVRSGSAEANEDLLQMELGSVNTTVYQTFGDVERHFEHATWDYTVRANGTGTVSIGWRYDRPDSKMQLAQFAFSESTPWSCSAALLTSDTGTVDTATGLALPQGEWIHFVVSVYPEGSNDRISVYMDGTLVLTALIAPQPNVTGPASVSAGSGVTLDVRLVEQYQAPVTPTRVGPS